MLEIFLIGIFILYLLIGVAFAMELVIYNLMQECESGIKKGVILLLGVLFLPLVLFVLILYITADTSLKIIDLLRG